MGFVQHTPTSPAGAGVRTAKAQAHLNHTHSKSEAWLDRLGITASMGCAIHCLFTGIFFLIFPALFEITEEFAPLEFLHSEWIHWGLAVVVVPVAVLSLGRGYYLHRKAKTIVLGGIGLAMILTGLTLHPFAAETILTMVGGLFLAMAHFLNLKGLRRCHLTSKVASTGQ